LLAAREIHSPLVTVLLEDREGIVGAGEGITDLATPSPLSEDKGEILLDSQAGEDPPTLGDVRYPQASNVVRRRSDYIQAADADHSTGGLEEAGDDSSHGGLSGAIRTEKRFD
jgi:hypothetical protein